MSNVIGEKIKFLRTLAEMSQEELGHRVGVQRAAINKYEKGSVTNIPIATIEKIANVFDVSPTFIVGWTGDESNPLSAEVKIIQGVNKFYGTGAVELLETYTMLTKEGKKKLVQYADDMLVIYKDSNVTLDDFGFEEADKPEIMVMRKNDLVEG